MANILGNYDPIFYASEALMLLYKNLGMAQRVFRGYDKNPAQLGSTIALKKPGTFTAVAAPGSSQAISTEQFSITLDQWYEVRFELSDKELSYSGQQIINDHITPAVYALADKIDTSLLGLYKYIPWQTGTAASTPDAVADIVDCRKMLFNNKVPMNDLHLVIDGEAEAKFLALEAFSQYQGGGDMGVATQRTGSLGNKYGIEISSNQGVLTHTKGTASTGTLAVNQSTEWATGKTGYAKGSTKINLDANAVTGTLVPGDVLTFAGHSQKYCVTNTVTAATNALAGVEIFPALKVDVADDVVVTATLTDGVRNLAFHRNAFALAMAPLPDFYDGQGVRVFTATDPFTQLAIRARTWADGDNSCFKVALDVLYGVKCLDANLGVQLLG